ncbi:MAG: HD domain-containing protein [Candidatus Omnitrophica bacterium]|nr:HD domain-containing protein [Candidatus Omnitrophota bacterium]
MKELLYFIAEAGMLKRLGRSGWSVLGVTNPETVAEHSFRCAVLGYVLARMENLNVQEVLLMTLFNDIQESRIGDLHKMAQKYITVEPAEDKCFAEQVDNLPKAIKQELLNLRNEYKKQRSAESIVARDADILECLIQAKEYYEQGFRQAANFMRKAPQHLKSKAARRIWRKAKNCNLSDWWRGLSQFKR